MTTMHDSEQTRETLDDVIAGLRELRLESGAPSYAEIATRIAERRVERGVASAAARVARSSVYDAFRDGRRRVNADLIGEIVLALTSDDARAEEWRTRSVRAAHAASPPAPAATVAPATHRAAPVPAGGDAALPRPLERAMVAASAPAGAPSTVFIATMIAAAVGTNLFGGAVAVKFEMPLFLDMIGTAVVAIVLGPWYGALAGFATTALAAFGTEYLVAPFAIVNVAGALVWGYGARWWRLNRDLPRLLVLSAVVAVVCTFLAVPINLLLAAPMVGHPGGETFVADLGTVLGEMWLAVGAANLTMSIADKLIAGMIAFVVVVMLARARALPHPVPRA